MFEITSNCICIHGYESTCQVHGWVDKIATDQQYTWEIRPKPDYTSFLEDKEFYDRMQAYRHSPITDPVRTNDRFEAVKDYIRRNVNV